MTDRLAEIKEALARLGVAERGICMRMFEVLVGDVRSKREHDKLRRDAKRVFSGRRNLAEILGHVEDAIATSGAA